MLYNQSFFLPFTFNSFLFLFVFALPLLILLTFLVCFFQIHYLTCLYISLSSPIVLFALIFFFFWFSYSFSFSHYPLLPFTFSPLFSFLFQSPFLPLSNIPYHPFSLFSNLYQNLSTQKSNEMEKKKELSLIFFYFLSLEQPFFFEIYMQIDKYCLKDK